MVISNILLIHGSIVVLLGLLSGFPFWLAIIRNYKNTIISSWRVAHSTLIVCGLIMIVFGLIPLRDFLGSNQRDFVEVILVISGYSFSIALIIGAFLKKRALLPSRHIIDIILFCAHMIGAVCSIIGVGVLIFSLL